MRRTVVGAVLALLWASRADADGPLPPRLELQKLTVVYVDCRALVGQQRPELRARVVGVYRGNSKPHVHYRQHPNLLWQAQARGVDRVWVGDVTHLRVGRAWRFLAMAMDQHSRRVLGRSLARVRSTRLTRAALDHAVRHRRPRPGLVFHSDRGSEHLGTGFSARLRAGYLSPVAYQRQAA